MHDAEPPPGPSLFDRIARSGQDTSTPRDHFEYDDDRDRGGRGGRRGGRPGGGFPPPRGVEGMEGMGDGAPHVGQKRRLQSAVLVDGETRPALVWDSGGVGVGLYEWCGVGGDHWGSTHRLALLQERKTTVKAIAIHTVTAPIHTVTP